MSETRAYVPAPVPADEDERLKAVRWSCLLDTPPEPIFDDLTQLASSLFDTPIASVSVIDEHRQFFKSSVGLPARETERRFAFCAHTILSNVPLVVPDALLDDRFRDNAFVHGEPWIRFYAGAPLIDKNGQKLGTFCVADHRPRHDFTPERYVELKRFATLTSSLIEQRLLEQELRHANERFLRATQANSNGIWDLDYITWEMHISARCNAMLGLPEQDTIGHFEDWIERIHPYDYERVVARLANLKKSPDPTLQLEYRCRHEDGSWRWLLTRVIGQHNEMEALTRITASTADITSARMIDALTGLHNRTSLLEHLQARIDHQSDYQRSYGLFFVDLDNFKRVNDSLGRKRGDAVLVEIARRMEDTVHGTPCSLAARLTGDEFIVLMDEASSVDDVHSYAAMLEYLVGEPIVIEGQEIVVSASVGMVFGGSADYHHAEQVLEDADVAMYRAKLRGRAQNAVFSSGMREEARARLQLETELRHALELNEVEVWYQPKVRLSSGQITGFESLVRWRSPRLGLMQPVDFIGVAEETGLISELGRWVATESISQLSAWRRKGLLAADTTIAVNVSPRQFTEPDLVEFLRSQVHAFGVPSNSLIVEVTENLLVENSAEILSMLRSLSGSGIGLDLDDFGTGYSSLSYLHRFPFHSVKIDRSFVARIGTDEEGAKLVSSIVALASSLGMSTIAEGVETEEQARALREMGCNFGQGFLFSPPRPAHEMERYLRERIVPGKPGSLAATTALPTLDLGRQESDTFSQRLPH